MQKKRGMGYALMLVAGLFLWNPTVGMVDPLPDLVGYLLLLFGLARLADLKEPVWEARERFRAVAWIALGELAAQLFIRFFLSKTRSAEDVYGQSTAIWILLFSFIITLLECGFLIPAYRKLLRGLGTVAERSNAAHLRRNRKGRTQYDRLAGFAVLFVAGKNLLSLLPEVASLSTYAYYQTESPWAQVDWYRFIDVIRGLMFLPALVLTLFWLVRWIRVFASAMRDHAFQSALREEYESKILPDTGLFIAKRVRLSFLLARVGAAFLPTFLLMWENQPEASTARFAVELLPDFAAVLFFGAAVLLLRKFERVQPFEIFAGVSALMAGALQWAITLWYYSRFTAMEAQIYTAAFRQMRYVYVSVALSSVLAAGCFSLYFYKLMRFIRREIATDLPEIKKLDDYRARFIWLFVLVWVAAVQKIVDAVLRPFNNSVWWLPMLVTVAMILVLSSVMSDISAELAGKYPSQKAVSQPPETEE